MTPILMLGAGQMGGALMEGWSQKGAFGPSDLIIRDPYPSKTAEAAAKSGARLNPDDAVLAEARVLLLAVKPQMWREAAAQMADLLAPDCIIVSIAAGVRAADISAAFGGRLVARIMPTTAVAVAKGVASVFAPDAKAASIAHALFDPVAVTVDVDDEAMMDSVVGISGSAPAYLYAFIEALEATGPTHGLTAEASRKLARATIIGAAALLEASQEDPAVLRKQVTSPGGTTQAALDVLMGNGGFGDLLARAVAAAVKRSRELAG